MQGHSTETPLPWSHFGKTGPLLSLQTLSAHRTTRVTGTSTCAKAASMDAKPTQALI